MFQVQQSSNTPSLATDMSGTDVYVVVADAGGGCCYPYLHGFDRFCDDVYARDVFWWVSADAAARYCLPVHRYVIDVQFIDGTGEGADAWNYVI
jgi:hypothetical protein